MYHTYKQSQNQVTYDIHTQKIVTYDIINAAPIINFELNQHFVTPIFELHIFFGFSMHNKACINKKLYISVYINSYLCKF